MPITFEASEYKPLSYAFNRAKAMHKHDFYKEVKNLIVTGRLRVKAKSIKVSEGRECYNFGKNELPFRAKSKEWSERDRIAYDLAHNNCPDANREKTAIFHGQDNTFVWLDIEEANVYNNAFLDIPGTSDYDDEGVLDYIAELEFERNFDKVEVTRIQVLSEQYMQNSIYRTCTNLIRTSASGLLCLKSEVETHLPHSKEHRSENSVGRPSAQNLDDLFLFLNKKLPSLDGREIPKKKKIIDLIREYEAQQAKPDGGVSQTTAYSYVKKYLTYRAENFGK